MFKTLNFTIFLFLIYGSSYAQIWQNYSKNNTPLLNNKINSIATNNDGTVWFGTDSGLASFFNNSWKVYYKNDELSSNKVNYLDFSNDQLFVLTGNGMDIFNVQNNQISFISNISNPKNNLLTDSLISFSIDSSLRYWLGSEIGLSIVNKDSTFNLDKTKGLSNNFINSINSKTLDWVHVATNGGGVNRFNYDEVDGVTSASDVVKEWSGLASDSVFCIFVTDDTLKWYGTASGVSTHFGDNTKSNWNIFNTEYSKIIDNYVRSIERDKNGIMWFGTRKGLSSYDPKNEIWKSYTVNDGLIGNNIFDLKIDVSNNLWIATDEGITKFSDLPTKVNTSFIKKEPTLKLNIYPNPFNPSTNVEFDLPNDSEIELSIFNLLGTKIENIINSFRKKGKHQFTINMMNLRHNQLSSGVYFITLRTEELEISKKILYLK